MSENKEELRPCPYHGDSNAMEFSSASKNFAACRKCDRENESWYRPIESWNSAYCWKEIDSLKAKLDKTEELLRYVIDDSPESIFSHFQWEKDVKQYFKNYEHHNTKIREDRRK